MSPNEFKAATRLALDCSVSLSGVDDSVLYGCGCRGFAPVVCTLAQAAAFIRYQVSYIAYPKGTDPANAYDHEELANLRALFVTRRLVTLIDSKESDDKLFAALSNKMLTAD